MESESRYELELPGFRFHPTEEELLSFYLKSMVLGKKFRCDIIGFLNIYNYDPRDLPGLAKIGEREWYFFVPRDRKHGSGGRPNRTTETGFWKATGSDRKILSSSDPKRVLGLKKTLVFYQGRAPHGTKTNWVMNEYRLPDKSSSPHKDIVLCKIYMKATSLKVLEQRAAMEDDGNNIRTSSYTASPSPPGPAISFSNQFDDLQANMAQQRTDHNNLQVGGWFKKESDPNITLALITNEIKYDHYKCEEAEESQTGKGKGRICMLPAGGKQSMADLQVPVPKLNTDWTQDSFWTQLSPWLDNFIHLPNVLS